LIGGTKGEFVDKHQAAGEDNPSPSAAPTPAALKRERNRAMTYGQGTRASAEDQAVERALARASGTWGGYQAWRQLDPEQKLELINKALEAANDRIDAYPIAL
jgi:predicted phage gp36 major capsid-like protein